jgi:hypothetical protein
MNVAIQYYQIDIINYLYSINKHFDENALDIVITDIIKYPRNYTIFHNIIFIVIDILNI